MALDATTRETNVKDSFKKFLIDALHPTYRLTFDKGLNAPKIRGTDSEKWVAVECGRFEIGIICSFEIRLYCCTKKDNSGFKLSQLRDVLLGHLTDNTQDDGVKRVALYKSHAEIDKWTQISTMVIHINGETGQLTLSDETKTKVIDITLKWGGRI